MSKNIISEINKFLNDDDKKTLEIEFTSFEVLYQNDTNNTKTLPSNRNTWKVFINKSFLFGNSTFYFRDGPKFVFALIVDEADLPSMEGVKEFKIDKFQNLSQEPIGGERIIITENKLSVNVFIKNGNNPFDINYLHQTYSSPILIKSYEENLDFKILTTNPSGSDNCYIATLVYEDIRHPRIDLLRNYRDTALKENVLGRMFIKIYYSISPKLVEFLRPYPLPQKIIRKILNGLTNKMMKK